MCQSIVGHGDGAVVIIALLSDAIRQNAYRERRVPAHEFEKLEECALGLAHAFLLAPQVYPARSHMPFMREYLPEIMCVIPNDTQVLACIPE